MLAAILSLANAEKDVVRKQIFNPNWKQSQQHGLALKVGFPTGHGQRQICWCCLEQINKEQIPLNQNTKQLQFLGFGFPLYFAFVRNCIFLLLVSICSYNLISIHKALSNNRQFCHPIDYKIIDQKDMIPEYKSSFKIRHFNEHVEQSNSHNTNHNQCTSWMIDLSRTDKKVAVDQQILRAASFAIHVIILVYIRDKMSKLKEYFDERNASPSDYSLLVKNLPEGEYNRKGQMKLQFEQLGNGNIEDIILIPDLSEFEQIQQKKQEEIEHLRKALKEQKLNINQTIKRQQKIASYNNQVEILVRKYKKLQKQNKLEASKAIVIMHTEQDKEQLLQNYEERGFPTKSWSNVRIVEAPEPRQIIWENISITGAKKKQLLLKGWLLSLLLLVVLTVIFAVVSNKKSSIVVKYIEQWKQQHQPGVPFKAFAIVLFMIFFVVLFNKIVISNLFHKFTDMEHHSSTYKFQFSFCLKYCLGLFFTTALMTLLVEAFLLKNYYKHNFGVIEQQTIMYIVNSIFVPLFWAVNPFYLYNRCKKNKMYGSKFLTQKQANQVMQMPSYDVGKRYGEVLEIVWFTFLYMTLIPIGGLISCVGLIFYYWIDKYNLLRRSSLRSYVSGELVHLTMSLLDFTLILRCAGQIVFDYQIRDGPKILSWISLIVSIIYQFMPIQKIIAFFNHQKFKSEQKTYKEALLHFRSSYYDENILFSYLPEDREELAKKLSQKLVQQVVLNTK